VTIKIQETVCCRKKPGKFRFAGQMVKRETGKQPSGPKLHIIPVSPDVVFPFLD
jgi:hypothetical protein